MRLIHFVLYPLLVITFFCSGCVTNPEKKEIISVGVVSADSLKPQESLLNSGFIAHYGNNYQLNISLYIPAVNDSLGQYPGMIFFDPHGHTGLPLQKYQSIADSCRIMLIGCNDFRNGLSPDSINRLMKRLLDFLVHDPVCGKQRSALIWNGFSGGARLAWELAGSVPGSSGLIVTGAGTDSDTYDRLQVPVFLFSGWKDMNYFELASMAMSGKRAGAELFYEYDGTHEWPHSDHMKYAFCWMMARLGKFQEVNNEFSRNVQSEIKSNVNNQPQNHENDLRYQYLILAETLFPGDRYIDQQNIKTGAKNHVAFTRQALKTEKTGRDEIYRILADSDTEALLALINRPVQMFPSVKERVLAFGGLVSYSLCSRAMANNHPLLESMVNNYLLLEKQNAEAWWFRAVLLARKKKREDCMEALKKSMAFGLENQERVRNQPDMAGLFSEKELSELVNKP